MIHKAFAKLTACEENRARGESYMDVVESAPMFAEGFLKRACTMHVLCGDSISPASTDTNRFTLEGRLMYENSLSSVDWVHKRSSQLIVPLRLQTQKRRSH